MRKTFLKVSLITCLAIASSAAFTGCKDYDDDINAINERIDQLEKTVNDINEKVKSGCVITSVTPVDGGVKVVLSDNTDFTITNGKDGATGATGAAGAPGTVWTIADGTAGKYTWFCDGKDMGISAQGPQGPQGEPGEKGDQGAPGATSAVVYYVPNATTGTFTEVTVAADGTKSEKDSGISFLAPGTITATAADGILTLYGVKGADGKVLDPIEISMTGDLRSLVFIPNLYLNGVEGTRYAYAPIYGKTLIDQAEATEGEANITTENGTEATGLKKSAWNTAAALTTTIYPVDTVKYELNPSNANLKGLAFEFINASKEAVSRADAPVAKVKVSGAAIEDGEGNLKVPYVVENAQAVLDPAQDADAQFSIFALTTTLTDENVITSDYATLVPAERTLRAIAFTTESKYSTIKADNVYGSYKAQDTLDLYWTGKLAVEHLASIRWQYNKGTLNLKNLLNVHYFDRDYAEGDTTANKVMTWDDLKAYGLTPKFEMMEYKVGENKTNENQYGKVDAATGVFTPQYVNDNGQSVDCGVGEDSKVGISAVGRRPVVRVTLEGSYTKDGQAVPYIALVGYVKIAIEEKVEEPETKAFVLDTFTNAYVCEISDSTTWEKWSGKVLETELGISRETFNNTWTVDAANVYELVNGEYKATTKFGTITYNADLAQNSTNDGATSANAILTWDLGAAAIDSVYAQPNHTKTLYKKFTTKAGSVLYIGLTETILDKPTVIYGVKIPTSWYAVEGDPNATTEDAKAQIRVNDAVPGSRGLAAKGTTYFAANLNDVWKGNEVAISTQTPNYTFLNATATAPSQFKYKYVFNKTQPTIATDYKLSTNATQDTLFVTKGTVKAAVAVLFDGSKKATAGATAPTHNVNDSIVYIYPANAASTATPKPALTAADNLVFEFINLFGHNETALAKMMYSNLQIVTTYLDCFREVNPFAFDARFLRPVDIVSGSAAFVDAAASGSSVKLGDLFTLEDWRDKSLFTKNAAGNYVAFMDNGNNLYTYYGVDSVVINIAKVETNQMGDFELMSKVNANLELVVNDAAGNEVTLTDGKATVDIAAIDNLNKATITYYNNGTTTAEFTLKIPVSIHYAWGYVAETYVTAPVGKTIANAAR